VKFYEEVTLERNKENSEIPDYGPSQADGIVIPPATPIAPGQPRNPYNPWGVALQPIGDALLEFGPQTEVVTLTALPRSPVQPFNFRITGSSISVTLIPKV